MFFFKEKQWEKNDITAFPGTKFLLPLTSPTPPVHEQKAKRFSI
jgi:hypothetical protein